MRFKMYRMVADLIRTAQGNEDIWYFSAILNRRGNSTFVSSDIQDWDSWMSRSIAIATSIEHLDPAKSIQMIETRTPTGIGKRCYILVREDHELFNLDLCFRGAAHNTPQYLWDVLVVRIQKGVYNTVQRSLI